MKPLHSSDRRWAHLMVWFPWICFVFYLGGVVFWYHNWVPDNGYRVDKQDFIPMIVSFLGLIFLASIFHLVNKFYLLTDLQFQSQLSPLGRGLWTVLLMFFSLVAAPIYYYIYIRPRPPLPVEEGPHLEI